MNKYLVFLVCLALLVPIASAQVLTSAMPNDPGEWTFALFGAKQSNVSNISTLSQTLYGVTAGYGLVKNLQMTLIYENGSYGGVAGIDQSLTSYTATLLYNLIQESEKIPVSVAFNPTFSLLTQKANPGGISGGSNYSLGVVASKMIGTFIPYVDLLYSSANLDGVSTEYDLTLGSIWAFSEQNAIVAENTWQFQPDGYTMGRASLALAYSL